MNPVLYAFKDFNPKGGAEKNLIEIAGHVSVTRKVYIITTNKLHKDVSRQFDKCFIFPSRGRKLFFLFDLIYVYFVCMLYKVGILHSHHRYPTFIASILRPISTFKLLTTIHNVFPDKKNFSNWGDRAIAVSKSVYEWTVENNKYPIANINIIYNGIYTPENYTNDDLCDLRSEINFNDDIIYFCSVGRLSEQKNYPLLFKILSSLESTKWALLLVGSGEQEDQLRSLAKNLNISDNIIFLGQRNDVHKIMQISRLFLLTSLWEGFPYVVVEALSNGLPVISTDVGGISEAIKDGETGYLFQIDDTTRYTDTLNMLILNLNLIDNMSQKCRKAFLDNYTIEKMYIETDKIYSLLE